MDFNEANANLPRMNTGSSPESSRDAIANPQQVQEVQNPAAAELASGNSSSAMPASLPSVQQQSQLPVSPVGTADDARVDDAPLVAADDEVIEQEWVRKAKQIVAKTKEDPYSQESEIGKLQADYIKKRYGKEVKLTDD